MKNSMKGCDRTDRRGFLKTSGKTVFGMAAMTQILMYKDRVFAQDSSVKPGAAPAPKPAASGDKLEMLKENDPQAQALGYFEDAKKVDTKKWPKRAGPDGAKQFCYNCQFFQAKGDPRTVKSAPCQIFAGKGVTAKGWCNTWTQNPAVKG